MKLKQTTQLEYLKARRRKSSNSRAGISIVESLIAITLFGIFVTGASKMLMSHRRMTDVARAHYTAVNIAKNRLEVARTFNFGQVDSFLEDGVLVDGSGFINQNGNYSRSTAITVVDNNLYEITVTVEIRDRKTRGFDGSREELKTYYAEYLTEDSSVGGGVASSSST